MKKYVFVSLASILLIAMAIFYLSGGFRKSDTVVQPSPKADVKFVLDDKPFAGWNA